MYVTLAALTLGTQKKHQPRILHFKYTCDLEVAIAT
jgi:hypothetical protein